MNFVPQIVPQLLHQLYTEKNFTVIDQNLKFHVTAGRMGNNDTCLASTFNVPS